MIGFGRRARLQNALLTLLGDPVRFADVGIGGRVLRPYQVEIMRAVWENIREERGDTLSFMLARQMGKNELVARLQAFLLMRYSRAGGAMVHGAPTFNPQALNARARLEECLSRPLWRRRVRGEWGRSVVVGRARVHFVSAEKHANRVGLSAPIALFADEFQDWEPGVFDQDFAPMRSTTNATGCVWGTAWRVDDPLQLFKEHNLELEGRDRRQRHFEFDWQVLAARDERYRAFVEREIARLGENHPIIRTQYRLLPLGGGGRLLSATQLRQLQGDHAELAHAVVGEVYAAGLDLAGEEETGAADRAGALFSRNAVVKRDSVALTVGRVVPREIVPGVMEADCAIVYRAAWVGVKHAALYRQILDLLKRVWNVRRVCVDATGVGAGLASFLTEALGAFTVEPCIFDSALKLHTELAFNFLAMVNSGRMREPLTEDGRLVASRIVASRLVDSRIDESRIETEEKLYPPTVDRRRSSVFQSAWFQYEHAQSAVRAGGRMKIFVPEDEGHDDLLISTLLCARAAVAVIANPSGVSFEGDAGQSHTVDGRLFEWTEDQLGRSRF